MEIPTRLNQIAAGLRREKHCTGQWEGLWHGLEAVAKQVDKDGREALAALRTCREYAEQLCSGSYSPLVVKLQRLSVANLIPLERQLLEQSVVQAVQAERIEQPHLRRWMQRLRALRPKGVEHWPHTAKLPTLLKADGNHRYRTIKGYLKAFDELAGEWCEVWRQLDVALGGCSSREPVKAISQIDTSTQGIHRVWHAQRKLAIAIETELDKLRGKVIPAWSEVTCLFGEMRRGFDRTYLEALVPCRALDQAIWASKVAVEPEKKKRKVVLEGPVGSMPCVTLADARPSYLDLVVEMEADEIPTLIAAVKEGSESTRCNAYLDLVLANEEPLRNVSLALIAAHNPPLLDAPSPLGRNRRVAEENDLILLSTLGCHIPGLVPLSQNEYDNPKGPLLRLLRHGFLK